MIKKGIGYSLLNEAPQSLSKKRFGKETWQLDNDEKLQFAIENCRRIRITYDDKKGGKGKNTRYLLPLVYGMTKNGKKAIRAFQTAGSTKRGVPKYKLFLFDNIGRVELGKIKYYDYEQQLLATGFNNAGDKDFSDIYSITPLARNFNSRALADKDQPIDSGPISKTDVTKSEPTKKAPAPTQKTQPAQAAPTKKEPISVDKTPENDYSNKMFAQDNEPVSREDLGGTESNVSQPTQNITAQDNGPVSKSDIDGVKIDKDNKLTNSYNDMMQRMDNLYKDDENNDEEEKS